MEPQSASAVLMIRPRHFAGNAETFDSNRFQAPPADRPEIAKRARAELDALAAALDRAGVAVHVLDGRETPRCPDEVFPNNWLSTHHDGTLVLYPMMAPSRRLERRADVVQTLGALGYAVHRVVDLTELESRGLFLEGTGSLVLDRPGRVAYACLSPRTSREAVDLFADRLGYETRVFDARDRAGRPIYHTNVLMSVGTSFAIVCAEAIRNPGERRAVLDGLRSSGRAVIEIGFDQLHAFAGNLLELRGTRGPVIALSARACEALGDAGRRALGAHGELVPAGIATIETYGGGSVRCMLAEVHLPGVSPAPAPSRSSRR
ncbi:MAG TPA: arginine deiminase-related protein [Gammaproteobacteria bacterium]